MFCQTSASLVNSLAEIPQHFWGLCDFLRLWFIERQGNRSWSSCLALISLPYHLSFRVSFPACDRAINGQGFISFLGSGGVWRQTAQGRRLTPRPSRLRVFSAFCFSILTPLQGQPLIHVQYLAAKLEATGIDSGRSKSTLPSLQRAVLKVPHNVCLCVLGMVFSPLTLTSLDEDYPTCFFCCFFSLQSHLQYMEVPRLGVALELQLPATPAPSLIFDRRCCLQQCQVLNPLSEAGNRTHILTETMLDT